MLHALLVFFGCAAAYMAWGWACEHCDKPPKPRDPLGKRVSVEALLKNPSLLD